MEVDIFNTVGIVRGGWIGLIVQLSIEIFLFILVFCIVCNYDATRYRQKKLEPQCLCILRYKNWALATLKKRPKCELKK